MKRRLQARSSAVKTTTTPTHWDIDTVATIGQPTAKPALTQVRAGFFVSG